MRRIIHLALAFGVVPLVPASEQFHVTLTADTHYVLSGGNIAALSPLHSAPQPMDFADSKSGAESLADSLDGCRATECTAISREPQLTYTSAAAKAMPQPADLRATIGSMNARNEVSALDIVLSLVLAGALLAYPLIRKQRTVIGFDVALTRE